MRRSLGLLAAAAGGLLTLAAGIAVDMDAAPLDQPYRASVACNDDYESLPRGCQPQACGRAVFDNVITSEEAASLRAMADEALAFAARKAGHELPHGWNTPGQTPLPLLDGPSIVDVNTGFARHSVLGLQGLYRDLGKKRKPTTERFVLNQLHRTLYQRVGRTLESLLTSEFGLSELHFSAPTFVARLQGSAAWRARDVHDEYWHPHVDRVSTQGARAPCAAPMATASLPLPRGMVRRHIWVGWHGMLAAAPPAQPPLPFFASNRLLELLASLAEQHGALPLLCPALPRGGRRRGLFRGRVSVHGPGGKLHRGASGGAGGYLHVWTGAPAQSPPRHARGAVRNQHVVHLRRCDGHAPVPGRENAQHLPCQEGSRQEAPAKALAAQPPSQGAQGRTVTPQCRAAQRACVKPGCAECSHNNRRRIARARRPSASVGQSSWERSL